MGRKRKTKPSQDHPSVESGGTRAAARCSPRLWPAILIPAGLCLGLVADYMAGSHRKQQGRDVRASSGPSAVVRSLNDLLAMPDEALEQVDPLEVDLAVVRTIPGGESLDAAKYKRTVDEWAEQVRSETDRHLYKFQQAPGEYKNSQAYFKALVLATVIGQDFQVGYDVETVSFDRPADLFVHGVIDQRRGFWLALNRDLGGTRESALSERPRESPQCWSVRGRRQACRWHRRCPCG